MSLISCKHYIKMLMLTSAKILHTAAHSTGRRCLQQIYETMVSRDEDYECLSGGEVGGKERSFILPGTLCFI
jgi:hypothetical protein